MVAGLEETISPSPFDVSHAESTLVVWHVVVLRRKLYLTDKPNFKLIDRKS